MSELKQAWEYSFIHSSATGRGDGEIGPCLTYEKSVAFGKGCIKQREIFVSTQPEVTAPAQDLSAAILALPLPDAFGVLHYNRAIGFAGRLQGYTADQMRGLLKDAAALASSANSRFDGSISKLGAPEAFVPSSPANALRATDKDAKIAAQRARILALEEQLARALGTPVNDWCPECHARESSGDALGAGDSEVFREFFRASVAWADIAGREEINLEEDRKAEARYEVALKKAAKVNDAILQSQGGKQ